jgi:hypothetical protein
MSKKTSSFFLIAMSKPLVECYEIPDVLITSFVGFDKIL